MRDPTTRLQILVSVGVLAVALGAGAWYGVQQPQPPPVAAMTPDVPIADVGDVVTVHVSGAVAEPGLVVIRAGGRIAEAIAAAGGALPAADLGALNLAAVVRESEHIMIPESGSETRTGSGRDRGIDLNLATAQELESLPGVGPVLAARIVDDRETHGLFEAVEDLLDVPGIGEAKLAMMRDAIGSP